MAEQYNHYNTIKIVDISPTEEMIMNDEALPKELRGYRCYRLEYGGANEDCLYEGRVLLPPGMEPQSICNLIMGAQAHEKVWTTV